MSSCSANKIDELTALKTRIETMSKTHHIEILKILKRFSAVKLNENKSGVFINLIYLPEEATDELQKYIEYIDAQESEIMTVESRKEEYKNAFFTEKQNKEEGVLLV
jgi:hypothetical protein